MEEKIRVGMIVNDLNINGISNVIMNYCCYVEPEKIAFTILTGKPVAEIYGKKCEELKIKILVLPERREKPFCYYGALLRIVSARCFDVIHVHGSSATILVELAIARLRGVKVRIAHCHASSCNNIKLHHRLKKWIPRVATHGFACSTTAGKWMFGDTSFYIIPNGFDTEQFKFDETVREKVRSQLGVGDKFVIGHVGRFNVDKNQSYLLELFQDVALKRQDAFLLLVGTGPMFREIEEKVQAHPYKERILLFGESQNVKELYSAMDVFVLPSRHEGLSFVLLEAQINGLMCIASSTVPREAALCEETEFLDLKERVMWVNKITTARSLQRETFYEKHRDAIRRYNIRENAVALEKLYQQFYRETYKN